MAASVSARSAVTRPARKPRSTAKPNVVKWPAWAVVSIRVPPDCGYRDGFGITVPAGGARPRTAAHRTRRAAQGQQVQAKRMRTGYPGRARRAPRATSLHESRDGLFVPFDAAARGVRDEQHAIGDVEGLGQ